MIPFSGTLRTCINNASSHVSKSILSVTLKGWPATEFCVHAQTGSKGERNCVFHLLLLTMCISHIVYSM